MSVGMDGADQSAHDLPKILGRVPKDLSPWPQKLQCVTIHGCLLAMFNVLNIVQGGANMAITCLMRALQLAGTVPRTLYLQVDGGSENWNQVLFGILDLLFDLYDCLQTVIISRLPVGHTHIDIDRFFSYLNGLLFGTSAGGREDGANVHTREDFVRLFHKAMAGNKDTMFLDHHFEDVNCVYDWWSFMKPHLYTGFSGYGSAGDVHVMKFERREGSPTPHVSYKYWHQSEQWMPADGKSLKILSSRPDLGDLSSLQASAHVEGHAEVIAGLQKPLLKWLQQQRDLELFSAEDVASWKTYFKTLGMMTLLIHYVYHMYACAMFPVCMYA